MRSPLALLAGSLVLTAVLVAIALPLLISCEQQTLADADAETGAILRSYATDFPFTENPISEQDMWLSGKQDGLDWGDVATGSGRAWGLQDWRVHYTDGTAILKGEWRPDQVVEARVFIHDTVVGNYPEVELRLRSRLEPHSCTGYEVLYGVARYNPYFSIVRWNGPMGDFTYLFNRDSENYGSPDRYRMHDGDVVRATIIGNVITAYVNGRKLAEVVDDTWTTGNPGMGFNYVNDPVCPQDGYGFTYFSASDIVTSPAD